MLTATTTDVPEGFAPNSKPSPLTDPWEPMYSKLTDKALVIGLRLAEPHTNARGMIHGGLIAALADKAMGHSCISQMAEEVSLVTISLSVDFTGTAAIGQWLTFESEVIKTGRSICFVQCLVKADGDICARSNATFRVVPKKH